VTTLSHAYPERYRAGYNTAADEGGSRIEEARTKSADHTGAFDLRDRAFWLGYVGWVKLQGKEFTPTPLPEQVDAAGRTQKERDEIAAERRRSRKTLSRTITGSKADIIEHLRERLVIAREGGHNEALTRRNRDQYSGEADGIAWAISVLEDWDQ
jgi:hypothetical protein